MDSTSARHLTVSDEDVLVFDVLDEALERAACVTDSSPAITWNYCTYNWYQCGPIG